MTKTKINTGAAVENHRQKDQGNASPKWIEAIQRQVKIGDTVNVKTNKCCSVDEGMSGKSGVWRKGTVIGIFRNFVHVRLQSGVCESVLWADIMNSSMEDDDEEETYKLVTSIRGNSMHNMVSIESPLGKAILRHKVGDRVEITTENGYSYFAKIRKIEDIGDKDDTIRKF